MENLKNKRLLETKSKMNDADNRARVLRKLKKAKAVYSENRSRRPRPLSPKTKIPR